MKKADRKALKGFSLLLGFKMRWWMPTFYVRKKLMGIMKKMGDKK